MRITLLIVLFTHIGLSYEFVVPLGILKLQTKETLPVNTEETLKAVTDVNLQDIDFIVLPFDIDKNKPNNLESYQNLIKENELYDSNNSKQSRVNERSFIYINQKFRSPALSQLYSPNDFLADSISVIGNERTINNDSEDSLTEPLYYKNSYLPPKVQAKEPSVSLYFSDENQDGLNVVPPVIDKMISLNDNVHNFVKNIAATETTQYIELLKAPILRTSNYVNSMERASWRSDQPTQTIHSDQYQKHKNGPTFIPYTPRYLEKTPVNNEYYNHMYPKHRDGIYKEPKEIETLRKVDYQNSGNSIGVAELGDQKVATDVILRKLLNDNAEMGKILQKYVKDSLAHSVANEEFTSKANCNHSDCIADSKVQYLKHLPGKNNCRCDHHRLNVTIKGFNELERDITTKRNLLKTDPYASIKSSEFDDYGDIIMDDANIEKTVRELVQ